MSTLTGVDRNRKIVTIGDVVMVIDNDTYIKEAIIVDFLYPFVDPIEVQFPGGFKVSRASHEIELVSESRAVLWKLENL